MTKEAKWLSICSFKHDGSVHRFWNKALLLCEDEELLIVGNDDATVYENDGRLWQVREPAITIFYKKQWYNVICMLRENGIHYYCNIASPSIIKDNSIIYIDYDLDLGIKKGQNLKILDEVEYQRHRLEMKYTAVLDYKLKEALFALIKKYDQQEFPFIDEKIFAYYQEFLKRK